MDGALSVAALFSTSSLTSFLNSSGARSICLYSESKRFTLDHRGERQANLFCIRRTAVTGRYQRNRIAFLIVGSCQFLRVLKTKRHFFNRTQLRAASDWVSKVAIVVLFPATQVTLSPGVKVKPSLDSPLQVAPVIRWLPPRVR